MWSGTKNYLGIRKRLPNFHPVPPEVMYKLYDMLVRPIFVYGSYVWGYCKKGQAQIDEIMQHYCGCVFNIKAGQSNVIIYDEWEIFSPSQWLFSYLCTMFSEPSTWHVRKQHCKTGAYWAMRIAVIVMWHMDNKGEWIHAELLSKYWDGTIWVWSGG